MAISRSQMGKQLTGNPQKKRGIPSTGSDERDVEAVRDYQTRMAPNRSFVAEMKKGGKICPEGKAWAKRTFDKYPSAYANLAASKYCKDPNYAKKSKGKKRKGK